MRVRVFSKSDLMSPNSSTARHGLVSVLLRVWQTGHSIGHLNSAFSLGGRVILPVGKVPEMLAVVGGGRLNWPLTKDQKQINIHVYGFLIEKKMGETKIKVI